MCKLVPVDIDQYDNVRRRFISRSRNRVHSSEFTYYPI